MRRIAMGFITSAVLIGFGCGDKAKPSVLDECSEKVQGDLYVGSLFPMSGSSAFGEDLEMGVELAVREVNQGGGIQGQRLGYVSCDSRGEPAEGLRLMKALARFDKLGAVIGPGRSVVAVGENGDYGVAHVAAETKTLLVSPSATTPMITDVDDDGYVFRTAVSDSVQGRVLAAIAEREGYRKVFVMEADEDPWAAGVSGQFSTSFGEIAGEGSTPGEKFDIAAKPYARRLLESADAAGADAILIAAFTEEAATILSEAASFPWQSGASPGWLIPDGAVGDEILPPLEELLANGARAFGTIPAAPMGPAYDTFAKRWLQVYGEAPDPTEYGANAYDALYLVAIAMQLSDDPTSGPALKAAILRTQAGSGPSRLGPGQWTEMRLASQGEAGLDYVGAAGSQEFDEHGDVLTNIDEWSPENGTFTFKHCWTPGLEYCQ